MAEHHILDASIVKDLLNHIYEKRKATAFQIEGLTKAALARSDSLAIYQIIAELTELANGGSTSAKMGAITALGSVSVALGSLAIAYFLESIVRPILATFRDTDARVRYYACESLYNIAKIARGEILLYFNEVFDVLCILVTDTESSVKNAADILDRLIKDIVSAKSTNYVSILHQQNDEENDIPSHVTTPDGVSLQINNPQDPLKAFLLPRFIPTLLERMYTIEPFAKKFLLGWLELFDDIPSSELITFLPNFLEPLIRFLMNNCPSDVRIETQNLLNIFLKEIKAIYKVKYELRKEQIMTESKKARGQPGAGEASNPKLASDAATLTQEGEFFPDNDGASVKSTSTTIIRKPENKADLQSPQQNPDGDAGDETSVFLSGQDIFIDYSQIIEILLSFIRVSPPKGIASKHKVNDVTGEGHEVYLEIQSTVLKWLQEVIVISPTSISKFLPDCVSIIMQNVALTDDHNDTDLRNQFLSFDKALRNYLMRLHDNNVPGPEDSANGNADPSKGVKESDIQGLTREAYEEFLELHLIKTFNIVMNECMLSVNELARLLSLEWLTFLYSNYKQSFFPQELELQADGLAKHFQIDMTALLKSSIDASNEVISKVLALAAQISEGNEDFFKQFMIDLIYFFETEGSESVRLPSVCNNLSSNTHISELSRSKVEFIIRQLCVSLRSEHIFKSLSEVLLTYESKNVQFLSSIVVTLNNILLTTPELQELRKKLKNLDISKSYDWNLFSTLFKSWSHNAPSALSLCLLTSNYELAFSIIKNLAEVEVTFQLLTQLDVLVQLLESHIFLKLRLQLLEPEKEPYLYKTLYGILMIMPQSSTYTILKNRLSTLTHYNQNSVLAQTPTIDSSGPGESAKGLQSTTRSKRIHELSERFANLSAKSEELTNEKRLKELASEATRSISKFQSGNGFPSSESKAFMPDYFYQAASEKQAGKHRR